MQRELPGKLVVEAGYVASKGNHLIDGGTSSYNQLPAQDFSLGNSLNDQVANPFFGVITDPTSTLRLADGFEEPTTRALSAVHGRELGRQTRRQLDLPFVPAASAEALLQRRRIPGGLYGRQGDHRQRLGQHHHFDQWRDRPAEHLRPEIRTARLTPDDISRRLVMSFNAEMPFGRSRHFLDARSPRQSDLLLGGWQFNGIVTLQSGTTRDSFQRREPDRHRVAPRRGPTIMGTRRTSRHWTNDRSGDRRVVRSIGLLRCRAIHFW